MRGTPGTGVRLAWPPDDSVQHRDEARAKSLDAGKVLVAVRLIDLTLATEVRLHGLDRYAVRFRTAISAALAHAFVDKDPLRRVRIHSALSSATLFRRARLIVDEHGQAWSFPQLTLRLVQPIPMIDYDARSKAGIRRIFVDLIGNDMDFAGSLGGHLSRDRRNGQRPVMRLTAGHRHRVIEEYLVGNVDAGCRGCPDGEKAGVIVGTIPKVLEDVLPTIERRLADPGCSFPTHVGSKFGPALRHLKRQPMTANATQRATSLWNLGRGVVRASGAEIRLAHQSRGRDGDVPSQPQRRNSFRNATVGTPAQQPLTDLQGDLDRIQDTGRGKKHIARLIPLAHDLRAMGEFIQRLPELIFDNPELLFDKNELIQTGREVDRALYLQRPDQSHLVKGEAQRRSTRLVDTQQIKCLTQVHIGFSGGNDADLGA